MQALAVKPGDDLQRAAGDAAVLADKGFGAGELAAIRRLIDAQDSDIFDVLAYVRFAMAPKARTERADNARKSGLGAHEGEMRAFLEAVLSAYERTGADELSLESLPAMLRSTVLKKSARLF